MDSTPQITSRMALVWMLLTSVSVCSVLSLFKWYGEGMYIIASYGNNISYLYIPTGTILSQG